MTTIFFDSHGAACVVCDPEHADAEAFGPAGTSRLATVEDLARAGLVLRRGQTAWSAALAAGRLVRGEEPHEFDTLEET